MSFSVRLFYNKTTVGKEYKEPKGRNGGAMLKLEYDKKEIEGVIDKIVKKTMNMDLTWDWPCGVAYYGISDAYEDRQEGISGSVKGSYRRTDRSGTAQGMDSKRLCHGTLPDHLIPGHRRAAVS